MRIVHVRQILDNDCAVAAASMVAGVDYETALSAAFPLRELGSRCIYPNDIRELLERLTNNSWTCWQSQPWHFHLFCNPILRRFRFSVDSSMIVCIARPEKFVQWRSHAIVVCNGCVYDSAFDRPVPLRSYPNRDWVVHAVIFRSGVRIARKARNYVLYCYVFNSIVTFLISVALLYIWIIIKKCLVG